MLTRIVSHAVQLSGTDGGAIYEYDEPPKSFSARHYHMEEELINALRATHPAGRGVVGGRRRAVSRFKVLIS